MCYSRRRSRYVAQWTVDELADKLGKLDITSIALALMFWQGQGVIEDVGDRTFQLRDSVDESPPLIPATGMKSDAY